MCPSRMPRRSIAVMPTSPPCRPRRACHIGSQLTDRADRRRRARSRRLADALRRGTASLEHIDVGGGLGIVYRDEQPPPITDLVTALCACVPDRYTIVMEPGRSLVGEAGLLLTRVEYVKPGAARRFVIVDAGMNDLLRPALYEAWHEVLPCNAARLDEAPEPSDVVGPICESGDWLARARELAAQPGDLLALTSAGAYGFVMASNYNARPRPAEVLVEAGHYRPIRARESLRTLMANELALLQTE